MSSGGISAVVGLLEIPSLPDLPSHKTLHSSFIIDNILKMQWLPVDRTRNMWFTDILNKAVNAVVSLSVKLVRNQTDTRLSWGTH
jgi:hypothetical protein